MAMLVFMQLFHQLLWHTVIDSDHTKLLVDEHKNQGAMKVKQTSDDDKHCFLLIPHFHFADQISEYTQQDPLPGGRKAC